MEIEIDQLVQDLVIGLASDRRKGLAVGAPETVNDERRGQHSRRGKRLNLPKFTRGNAALDDAGDDDMSGGDDVDTISGGTGNDDFYNDDPTEIIDADNVDAGLNRVFYETFFDPDFVPPDTLIP